MKHQTALTLTFITITSCTAVAPRLDLPAAIDMAYKHRPSLKALNATTREKTAAKKKTMGDYFPQASLRTFTNTARGQDGLRTRVEFSVKQLVYSFAGPQDYYAIARFDERAAQWAERAHRDLIRNEVEVSFFESWLTHEQHRQARTQASSARAIFNQDAHENAAALLDRNDWLNRTAVYAAQTSEANQYRDTLQATRSSLERALGFASPHPPSWRPQPLSPLLPTQEYVDLALENRKELRIKQFEIDREKRTELLSIKSYLPTISLQGSSTRGSVRLNTFDKTFSEFGGVISWDFLDGAKNHYDAEAARSRALRARLEKQDIAQRIREEVEIGVGEASKARKRLGAEHVRLVQAENEYRLKKQEHEIGLIAPPDLEAARFRWENLRFSWLEKRVAYEIAYCDVLFACGYPAVLD